MVSCSRKRKSECRSPCVWEVGRGCRHRSESTSPHSCVGRPQSECTSPCLWNPGIGCLPPYEYEQTEPCPSGKVFNPYTGHCISKNSRLGQQLLKQMDSIEPIDEKEEQEFPETPLPVHHMTRYNYNQKVRETYGNVISDMSRILHVPESQITFIKYVGGGAYGQVYVVDIAGRLRILKFAQLVPGKSDLGMMQREFRMQHYFYKLHINTPKPLFYGVYDTVFFMGMKLDPFTVNFGTFLELIQSDIPEYILTYMLDSIDVLMKQFKKHNVSHGDFHWGNIAFQDSLSSSQTALIEFPVKIGDHLYYLSPLLIDFGFARTHRFNPDEDFLQLLNNLFKLRQYHSAHPYHFTFLYQGLMKLVDKHALFLTSQHFPETLDWTESEYNHYVEIYHQLRAL